MLSCTVINARRPELAYNYACGGYIIRPTTARVRCAYDKDAGSLRFACSNTSNYKMAKRTLRDADGSCLGGCGPAWCDAASTPSSSACAWRTVRDAMLEQGSKRVDEVARNCSRGPVACTYNEVVISLKPWRKALPDSIEAFFVTPSCDAAKFGQIASWHAQLFNTHPFAKQLNVSKLPLLLYDPQQRPAFRDVTPAPPEPPPPSSPEPPPLPALPHDCSWRLDASFVNLKERDLQRWCSDLHGRESCQQHYYFRRSRRIAEGVTRGGELVRCVWQASTKSCKSGQAHGVNVFACPPPPPTSR